MTKITDILGVEFDDVNREELSLAIRSQLIGSEFGYIVTPNPEIVRYSLNDDEYNKVLNGATFCVADGVGIELAARMLNKSLQGRIPGIEVGENVLAQCASLSKSVYFLGGREGVAAEAAHKKETQYNGLKIAGHMHGYFSDAEEDKVIDAINESGAEVLFVCLGFPRQEKFISRNSGKLKNVKLALALGGSLDVYSGNVRRAPTWFIKHNIEWLWRGFGSFNHFKRMLKLPLFLLDVVKYKINKING